VQLGLRLVGEVKKLSIKQGDRLLNSTNKTHTHETTSVKFLLTWS